MTFKITELYTGKDGKSHFRDVVIETNNTYAIGMNSDLHPANGIIFRTSTDGMFKGLHNAPRKQYVICLNGGLEITATSGETRCFTTGDVILALDVDGDGHESTVIGDSKFLIIPIES
jgi:hypothetical protein